MTLHRSAHGPIALLLALACLAAQAAEGGEAERLQRERRDVEARHAREAAACRQQFAVTACLEHAHAERRAALEHLHQQQVVLDDARRRERAAQRLRAIQSKTAELDARGREPAAAASSVRSGRAPSASAHPTRSPHVAANAPSAVVTHKREPARDTAKDAQDRQRRAAAAEQRRVSAERHRKEVELRNAERDRVRRPAAPLPLPASAAQ